MALASAREILAAARRHFIERTPVDSFFPKNTVLEMLWKNKKKYPGGREMAFPVSVGGHGTVQKFTGYDTVTVTTSSDLVDGRALVKHIAAPIEVAETDLITVSGPEKIVDLMDARRTQVIDNVRNQMGTFFFSDNPVGNANDWNAISFLVNNAAGDTASGANAAVAAQGFAGVLGIPTAVAPTNYPTHVSTVLDAADPATGLALGGPGITKNMVRRVQYLVQAERGLAEPGRYCWIHSQLNYEALERQLDPQTRYDSKEKVEGLIPEFISGGVKHRWDPHCPNTDSYLVDETDLHIRYHPMAAMEVTEFESLRNDVATPKFVWRAWVRVSGQFLLTHRRNHGRITNLTVV